MPANPLETLHQLMKRSAQCHALLLENCRSQQRAIRSHDYEALDAKADDMRRLKQEAAQSDAEVESYVPEAAHLLGLPRTQVSFRAIVEAAPEPWASTLTCCQQELRQTYGELLHVARASVESMQRAAATIDDSMHAFMTCAETPPALANAAIPSPAPPVLAERN